MLLPKSRTRPGGGVRRPNLWARVLAACVGVVAFLPGPGALAQGVVVTGRVLDDASGAPIPTAVVDMLNVEGDSLASSVTASDGVFRFEISGGGVLQLRGRRIGYRSAVVGPVTVARGDTLSLDFRLGVDAVVLEALTVTASARPWYEHLMPPGLWTFYRRKEHHERLGMGRFLTPKEMLPWDGAPVALMVASVPGISAVPGRQGQGHRLVGRGGCEPLIYIDGIEVKALGFSVDDLVTVNMLDGLEVYRGAAELPGELRGTHARGNCGAVVFWTKRTRLDRTPGL